MTREVPKELFNRGLITEEQFEKIEAIASGKIVSVFYELRSMLYLGVMLFTGGLGILIYQNIGTRGHVLSIIALSCITVPVEIIEQSFITLIYSLFYNLAA